MEGAIKAEERRGKSFGGVSFYGSRSVKAIVAGNGWPSAPLAKARLDRTNRVLRIAPFKDPPPYNTHLKNYYI